MSASDLIIAPSEGIRPGRSGARLAAGHDAGNQRHQAKDVAPVQRHLEHFSGFHDLAEGRVLRLEEGRLRRDLDDLVHIADLHADVDTHGALHLDRDGIANETAES